MNKQFLKLIEPDKKWAYDILDKYGIQQDEMTSAYFIPNSTILEEEDKNKLLVMCVMGIFLKVPMTGGFIYFLNPPDAEQEKLDDITVSPTHVRLPKLSYLITLTSEDFSSLFRTIASAKNNGNSLTLNSAYLTPVNSTFFIKLKTNYRLNPAKADKKWTSLSNIHLLAEKADDTETFQLQAMQYLTYLQNDDIHYFPSTTATELEIDGWEEEEEAHIYAGYAYQNL